MLPSSGMSIFALSTSRFCNSTAVSNNTKGPRRFKHTLLEIGNACCVLKLKEAFLKHELRRNAFYPHQVENHVIPQMKCRIELILLPANNFFGNRRVHLFINHHYDYSSFVKASSARSARHLYKFGGSHPALSDSVEFPYASENDCFRWHVQTDGESFCCKEDLDQAFLKKD